MNYEKKLKDYYDTYLINSDLLTPCFIGEKGLGKTQLVKDFCKENDLELIILNLSAMESSDFTGLPRIVDGITTYSKPSFLNLKKGIVFIDEINCINDVDVKSALKSLLQDKMINTHKLSREVAIVTACNPNTEDYDNNSFDVAIDDRFEYINFTRTYKQFLEYLEKKHERSNFLDFLKLHGEAVKSFSFRRIEQTLNIVTISNDVERILSYLSPSVYTLYVEYLNKNLFNFKDLLNGEIKDKALEASAEKKLLLDLHEALKSDFKFTKTNAKNVNKFLNEVRAENKQLFFKGIQELAQHDNAFDAKKVKWKELNLFDGLQEFLSVYLS